MVAGSSVTLVIFQSSNWVWRIAQMPEISKRQIQTEYEMFDIAIHARLPHSLSGVGAISQIIITSTHNPNGLKNFLRRFLFLAIA